MTDIEKFIKELELDKLADEEKPLEESLPFGRGVPHPLLCFTCQHYEPYHCTLDEHDIGYDSQMKTSCRAYRLHCDIVNLIKDSHLWTQEEKEFV